MNLFKTVLFTVLVPAAWTLFFPYWLFASGNARADWNLGESRWLGILLILFGAVIYLRCAGDFVFAGKGTPAPIDPPKELVVGGLYSYVRNPMYLGVMVVLLGEALFFESLGLLKLTGISFVVFSLFVLLYEEPALKRKFGASYQRYREAMPRWLPRLKRPRGKPPSGSSNFGNM